MEFVVFDGGAAVAGAGGFLMEFAVPGDAGMPTRAGFGAADP